MKVNMLDTQCPRCGGVLSFTESQIETRVVCPFCQQDFELGQNQSDEARIARILKLPELKELLREDSVKELCADFYPGKNYEIIISSAETVREGNRLYFALDGCDKAVSLDERGVEVGILSAIDQKTVIEVLRCGVRISVDVFEMAEDYPRVAMARTYGVSLGLCDDPLRRSAGWITCENIMEFYKAGQQDRFFFYALLLCADRWNLVYRVAEVFYKRHHRNGYERWMPGDKTGEKTKFLKSRILSSVQERLPEIYRRAEAGDPEAMNALAELHWMGMGVEHSIRQANIYAERAGAHGNAEAIYSRGLLESQAVLARSFVLDAADRGCSEALYDVSKTYRSCSKNRIGLPYDYEEGIRCLQLAADKGYIPALLDMGRYWRREIVYTSGYDYEKSLKIYRDLSHQGVSASYEQIGRAYEHGLGCSVDYERANLWYDLAISTSSATHDVARKGRERMLKYCSFESRYASHEVLDSLGVKSGQLDNSIDYALTLYDQFRIKDFLMAAQYNLSDWRVVCRFVEIITEEDLCGCHVNHDDIDHRDRHINQEQHAALQLLVDRVQDELRQSWVGGNVDAEFWIAWLLLRKFSLPFPCMNDVKTMVLHAANEGSVVAQEFLGRGAFVKFDQNEKDNPEVRKYLSLAMLNDSVRACLTYTRSMIFGHYGITKDYPRRFDAYLKAASLGNAEAMYAVGEELVFGRILGAKDDKYVREVPELEQGIEWWRKAACLGNGEALFRLGRLYCLGKGLPRDVVLSRKFFQAVKELPGIKVARFTQELHDLGLKDVFVSQGGCPYSVDSAIRELESSIPKESAVVLPLACDTTSKVKLVCPSCGRLVCSNESLSYGETVRCEACGFQFLYYVDHPCVESNLSRVALWQQGLLERINWPSSEFGQASFWLTDFAVEMLSGLRFSDDEELARTLALKVDQYKENKGLRPCKLILAVAGVKCEVGASVRYYEWDPDQDDYMRPTAMRPSNMRISKDFARWLGCQYGYQRHAEDDSSVYFFNQDIRTQIGDERSYEFLDAVKRGNIKKAYQDLLSLLPGRKNPWQKCLTVMTSYWAGPDTVLRTWSPRECDYRLGFPGDLNEESRYYGDEFNPGPLPIIIPKAVAYLLMNFVNGTIAKSPLQKKDVERTSDAIVRIEVPSSFEASPHCDGLICSSELQKYIPSMSIYHMASIVNLPSLLTHGIMSKHLVELCGIGIDDISDRYIQCSLREQKNVFDGHTLHDYASFYMNPRNAMLFRVCKERGDSSIVILEVDLGVIKDLPFAFSNMNAASGMGSGQQFYRRVSDLELFDWPRIFAKSWVSFNDRNAMVRDIETERKMQAEVLVLGRVLPKYFRRIHCISQDTASALSDVVARSSLVPVEICVSPELFFERRHESYQGYGGGDYRVD